MGGSCDKYVQAVQDIEAVAFWRYHCGAVPAALVSTIRDRAREDHEYAEHIARLVRSGTYLVSNATLARVMSEIIPMA
ncbi:hypothetical protein D7024_09410 [Desulfofundulus salinus]|uniref:Uncharacterized protein n=1 Tax=Desulfofundulus salinus TaxID=2419843 RepID=A0A494X1X6_9FIRM|nr:hypothetical protein D7024_09410 [Desulfofundulus salinum]